MSSYIGLKINNSNSQRGHDRATRRRRSSGQKQARYAADMHHERRDPCVERFEFESNSRLSPRPGAEVTPWRSWHEFTGCD